MMILTTEPVADQDGRIWPAGTQAVAVDGVQVGPGRDFRVVGDHDHDHLLWALVPAQYEEVQS
jgi:hypothetical protein